MGHWKELSFMDEWDEDANGPLNNFEGSSQAKVQWRCRLDARHFWSTAIVARKTNGSGCPVCLNQKILPGVNDLFTTHPQVAVLLDPEKSGFAASEVSSGNNKKKGYWDCPNHPGHKGITTTHQMVKAGCVVCSGRQVVTGYNDLATTHPALKADWHPTKNLPLDPAKIAAGTGKKIWWRCPKDLEHEWVATGDSRTSRGSGCPYCANQKLQVGKNDLLTLDPLMASFWAVAANGLEASEVYFGSISKKRWWNCVNGLGHVFQATIPSLKKSLACSVCEGRDLEPGFNDLATMNPDLAKEWHPTKNGALTPRDVFPTSDKKIWWQCPADSTHEWEARLRPRHTRGIGCPICGNDWVLQGVNDLASTRPDLVKGWSFEMNRDVLPTSVTRRSKKKVWWECETVKSHLWQSTVFARDDGKGCLYCTGQLVETGVNDLATRFPEIAFQWNYQRNGQVDPRQVFARTGKKYWWRCSNYFDHEWKTSVSNRTREEGNGCPYCAGKTLLIGFNDLESKHPNIAALWNYEKNSFPPSEVLAGSHKRVWWQCPASREHTWIVPIISLVSGTRCPSCHGIGFDQTAEAILYLIQNPEYLAKKLGITNTNKRRSRLDAFQRAGWHVIHTVGPLEGHVILELETRLLRWIRNDLGLPPFLAKDLMKQTAGWSETFSSEAIPDKQVIDKIDEILVQFSDNERSRDR